MAGVNNGLMVVTMEGKVGVDGDEGGDEVVVVVVAAVKGVEGRIVRNNVYFTWKEGKHIFFNLLVCCNR